MSAPIESRQLLCLTMMGYMKEGINEEELCQFQVNQHSRLVCGLMEKYGVLRYEIVRRPNPKNTTQLLASANTEASRRTTRRRRAVCCPNYSIQAMSNSQTTILSSASSSRVFLCSRSLKKTR